jgi:glycosyltransferase involved in cell wall biosynthesis
MNPLSPIRLGVIVPARDEARTILAKLQDLAACAWPAVDAGRGHALIVVDDHSSDGTAQLASAFVTARSPELQRLAARGVEVIVAVSRETPGKPGAIRAGLAQLRALGFDGDDDLVLLTDADVRFEPSALVHVAASFQSEPRLGMVTGAQDYVSAEALTCVPRSTISPASSTRIWSALRMVESRCAITNVVRPERS